MRRIDLIQGSEEWKAWRNAGVGASDCPIIMSGNLAKIERLKAQKWGSEKVYETAAMTRGKDLEPEARAEANKELLCKLEPVCFQSLKYPGLLCSLDGWFQDTRTLVEIKCPGAATCRRVESGDIPIEYVWQIQHQIAVTNALSAYLAVYDGASLQMVFVKRNQDMIDRLVSSETAFLESRIDYNDINHVQVPVINDRDLEETLARLVSISSMMKELDYECKSLKAAISEMEYPQIFKCGAFTAKWNSGRNSVDYKSVPQLRGVDLAPYTKKGSGYWVIS